MTKISGILKKAGVSSVQVFSATDFGGVNDLNVSLPVLIYGIENAEQTRKKLREFYNEDFAIEADYLFISPKPLLARDSFGFADLKEIFGVLRGPNGCPWDRAQTHESIRANAIEEAYELADAVDRKDYDNMCEELGDCILQAFFHTELAMEKGEFGYKEVLTRLCKKLISRHTHIFGGDVAKEAGQAVDVWERNKAAEKHKSGTDAALPALMRAYKIQKKAAKVGFDWADAIGALKKTQEEFEEVYVEIEKGNKSATEEECGDLLFALVNVFRFCGIEPETALNRAIYKFQRRFEYVGQKLKEKGKTYEQSTLDEMEELWQQAKKV